MEKPDNVIVIGREFVEQTSQHLAAQRYSGGVSEGRFAISVCNADGEVLETTAVVLPDKLTQVAPQDVSQEASDAKPARPSRRRAE